MTTTAVTAIEERLLLGPGPSNPSPNVLQALTKPMLGHLDPEFIRIFDSCKTQLRSVFKTENEVTFPVSGTGTSGMELLLDNFLERGDRAVVAVGGFFGGRMADFAERIGAETIRYNYEWGTSINKDKFLSIIEKMKPKFVAVVHAETSTGVCQDITGFSDTAHANGAIFCLDCVTSLATCELEIDGWGVDIAFSCSQKGLACPPGLSPVTASQKAIERLRDRRTTIPSFYFNLKEILPYISGAQKRAYHHTAPISMIYGIHEGLREVLEEGLQSRWQRHRENAHYLIEKAAGIGLMPIVKEEARLNALTTFAIPEEADDQAVRSRLLDEYGIEIGAGFGQFAGKIWRIGLMGPNSRRESVDRLMDALGAIL